MAKQGVCRRGITRMSRIHRTVPIFLIRLTGPRIDNMTIEISLKAFTTTAILTAIKRQQPLADWHVVSSGEEQLVLGFSHAKDGDDDAVRRFYIQLSDEMIREKLEKDFSSVRDRLVDLALSPIIKS